MEEKEKEIRGKEVSSDIDDEEFLKTRQIQKPSKKSKTPVVLGIIAVIFIMGVVIAYFFSVQNTESSTKKESSKTINSPKILKLEPFIVNLADKVFTHPDMKYVKASVEIEFTDEYSLKLAESRTPQIRDAIISILTQLTSQDIITPEGKQAFKDGTKQIVSGIVGEENIKNVYLTELVMQ